jgi:nucleotide-binding universal stress UspA family protein
MGRTNGKVVVVGVDFHACSDEGVLAALRMLGDGSASKVHLLHVLDPRDVIDSLDIPSLETADEVIEHAPGVLRERAAVLAERHGVAFERERVLTHARIGPAVDTLLQMAVDYDADLLIVGTHGRRGLSRLALGSVAERLVRDARCPVLVARAKDYAGATRTELPDPPPAPGEPLRRAPPRDVTDHVVSTESDSWRPSHPAPTGFRIV